jgi:hypothetical protein
MFVCCECCVLSGAGLCNELITRPEESYRMRCVIVRDLETLWMRRSRPTEGWRAKETHKFMITDYKLQEFQWTTFVRSRQYEYYNSICLIGQVLNVTSNPQQNEWWRTQVFWAVILCSKCFTQSSRTCSSKRIASVGDVKQYLGKAVMV